MFNYLKNFLMTNIFNLADIEYKLDKMYIESKITEAERDELLAIAAEHCVDSAQIDYVEKLKELEDRIFALEHPEPTFAIWVTGYVTKNGETVQYDADGDGVMELCRYDGGRAETSLRPFKIEGWHIVDAQGNIIEAE